MAKVSLLTIHWGNSYGGTMQTYATVKILQEMGHEVQVINLKHPKTKLSNLYKKGFSRSRICQDLKFYLFKKFFIGHFTDVCYSIEDCKLPDCDIMIVGSDQVWNRDITYPIHKAYFLDFVKGCKKLAFSSSFGKYVWEEDDNYTSFVKGALLDFDAISVREESGVDICRNIFGISATHVLDPTLVYSNFSTLIKKKKPIKSIYPFLLIKNEETVRICNLVSSYLSLPLYKINRLKNFLGFGPLEWLYRIMNSEFIITDSFHGLAFSIIFKKKFIILCADDKKFTRLLSLLKLLHLEDRYVESAEDLQSRLSIIYDNIDYSIVNSILNEERRKAISFLKNNI